MTFGIFTGCVQNSIKVFTNPFHLTPEGYEWYWIIIAVVVLTGAFFFLHLIASELKRGLKGGRGEEKPDLKWIETETFPKGLRGKKKIKYSDTTYFDLLCCLVFSRNASYGTWVPQSETKYDTKRAKGNVNPESTSEWTQT